MLCQVSIIIFTLKNVYFKKKSNNIYDDRKEWYIIIIYVKNVCKHI